jgi:hypothetical protein
MEPWEYKVSRRPLSSEQAERVDARFKELSSRLAVKLYLILTEKAADEIAREVYILLEPVADVVVAVATLDRTVRVHVDETVGNDIDFRALMEDGERMLREGSVFDALMCVLDRADKCLEHATSLLRPSRGAG